MNTPPNALELGRWLGAATFYPFCACHTRMGRINSQRALPLSVGEPLGCHLSLDVTASLA